MHYMVNLYTILLILLSLNIVNHISKIMTIEVKKHIFGMMVTKYKRV